MDQKLIPGIPDGSVNKILKLLKSYSPKKTILFGSRANGQFREGSDIDIALQGNHLRLDDRTKILTQYHDLNLPWKLDLVIYDLIEEPRLKEHIDQVGRFI